MGSKGGAYDNAVAESFFATLKKELVHRRSWPTRRELIGEVFEYIEALLQPAPAATRRSGSSRPSTTRTELSARPVPVSPLRGSHTPPDQINN